VKPEVTAVARQRLHKQISATTNKFRSNGGIAGSGVFFIVHAEAISRQPFRQLAVWRLPEP
jgi:hypothetical protein